MASSYCDNSAVQVLLSLKAGGPRGEAGTVATIAREARSTAAAATARHLASPASRESLSPVARGRGAYLEGIRNRLFLKYTGVDYEFYNSDAMRYRSGAV